MLSVEDILQPENVSYTDNVWTWAVAHMLHKGEDWQITTITDTAPIEIVFLSKGEPLTDYLISGNTVQNGTPTPEAPVDVVGCGVRTENVMPAGEQKTIESNGIIFSSDGKGKYTISGRATGLASATFNLLSAFTTPISVSSGGKGTLSFFNTQSYNYNDVDFYFYNGETKVDNWHMSPIERTNTTYNVIGNKYIDRVIIKVSSGTTVDMTITPEFTNNGALPASFEPYGYKLAPTVNGTEYPIYLGQVPTTRRIRKLVLTGEETIHSVAQNIAQNAYCFTYKYSDLGMSDIINYNELVDNIPYPEYISSHFKMRTIPTTQVLYNDLIPGEMGANSWATKYIGWRNQYLVFCTDFCSTETEFKSYLAAQYANGTPVTVWYVLAEPETGIVNEPLMKIGDYADTISMAQAGVTIPTVAGANTLTVGTTVQPSAVSITGNIKEVQGT